jgi:predicted alpha-1,6-mannanase (GH76 family)
MTRLIRLIDQEYNGLFRDAGWWNAANAYHAIIDKDTYSRTDRNKNWIVNGVEKTRHWSVGNWIINEFIDDEGWWGMMLLRAHLLYGDEKYVEYADKIWEDMNSFWSDQCKGGLYWSKEKNYKSAISNELFVALSAKLHLLKFGPGKTSKYLKRAEDTVAWLKSWDHLPLIDEFVFRDGVTIPDCGLSPNQWTYNSGVIVGGLVDMAIGSGKQEYMDFAEKIAFAAMKHFTLDDEEHQLGKVLVERVCESTPEARCDGDQKEFKGIFVRNLGYLYQKLTDSSKKVQIRQFIKDNVDSILENNRPAEEPDSFKFGCRWTGPYIDYGPVTMFSAVDLFTVAIMLNSEK